MGSSVRSKVVFGATLLAATCALLAPAPASGQRWKLSSFLKGTVTFTLPEGWNVHMYFDTDIEGGAELGYFYPEAPGGMPPAFAFLRAKVEREYKTVKEALEPRFLVPPRPGEPVLSDTFDGTEWCTRVRMAESRLVLSRVGLVNQKLVSLTVGFPPGEVSPEMQRRLIADFNAVCESLKIDGRNRFDNRPSADKILERVGMGEK